jgi:hypothetical protein
MSYQITKEIRIHNNDFWFYQFTSDEYGSVEISYYEMKGKEETKVGQSILIPKDCITHFINTLSQFE